MTEDNKFSSNDAPHHRFKRLIDPLDDDIHRVDEDEIQDLSGESDVPDEENDSDSTIDMKNFSGDVNSNLEDTTPVEVIQSQYLYDTDKIYVIPEDKFETQPEFAEKEKFDYQPGSRTYNTTINNRPVYLEKAEETYKYNGYIYPTQKIRKRDKARPRNSSGCLVRTLFISIFIFVLASICAITFGLLQYYQIASSLPDISDLRQNASQFETTRILDRDGNVLYEILDPNAGRRTYVPLEKISPFLVAATVATEDKGFYTHPGFDPTAIFRAFIQNYQSGETVSGASTITQQLARTLLFTPEERSDQSYNRKMREAVLATEITRRYSKDEILELYLNEIYYGNLAYGVEAAAETYFGTTADKLTLGQAAFLAGLPQAPAVYDIYTNKDATLSRLDDVLLLMYEDSEEQDCIYVSNNPQRICIDPVDVTNAAVEIRNYDFKPPNISIRSPHWVNYIRSELEKMYDAQTLYRAGYTVYTTLNPEIQKLAEEAIDKQISSLIGKNANNGAVVAMEPSSGEILAMVGSADYDSEGISGQVNMAISPRQPGSSIKPITYLAAFEKGWTPATIIWDVPSEFPPSGQPDDTRPPYKPVNYDGRFHGPVSVRSALANSYNLPAVKTLDFVGIYDDPQNNFEDGFISMAKRLGITSLIRDDYGLSLTLGGGEVSLLELTSVYATLANNGRKMDPVGILKILDHEGNVVFQNRNSAGVQVLRPEHVFLITSILSDNEARTPAFGRDSILNLPFQVAAKTGTTNDFRDNLTFGYTPDLAAGVWVGNADYTPMQDLSGVEGAAPIWSDFMVSAENLLTNDNPTPFTRPGGIIEKIICEFSGTEPSEWCPKERREFFVADQPPPGEEEDLWQKILLDTWTGLKASEACSEYTKEDFAINVIDPWAKKWLRNSSEGRNWAEKMGFSEKINFAPERECRSDDPQPILEFLSPSENETITKNPLEIFGIADATRLFKLVRIEYGEGDDPDEWQLLAQGRERINRPELLYSWDLTDIPEGIITLKLYMESTEDTYAEKLLHLRISVPTPTPTPTDTPTLTPTYTPTASITPTFTPSPTNIPTSTFTPTQIMENTPTIAPFIVTTPLSR